MAALTLQIEPLEGRHGWEAVWLLDHERVGAPITIVDGAADAVRDLARRFLDLFEQEHRPLVDPDGLRGLGRLLSEQWFGSMRPLLDGRLGSGPHELLIRTIDPNLLNLPWELIELLDDLPLGCDAAWSLRRTPLKLLAADGALEPGPLRIIFLAAAPVDQPRLDYEREEDAILRATAHLREDVIVHFSETGSFQELSDLVAQVRPHVVHLSGHGAVQRDGSGSFEFETERGHADTRDAREIVASVFRGSPVRCVFFNACQTSQAATAGLCQALVSAGLPFAIGWAASVADDLATDFAETFYRRLTHGEPITTAVAHARETVRRGGRLQIADAEVQDATFALPQVYCSSQGALVLDADAPPRPYSGPRTERELLGDGITGLRQGFVGRRREIQRLLPALRDGDVTVAILTGIGGAGKSTLATRAAGHLQGAGFSLSAVRAIAGSDAAECGRGTLNKLIGALEIAFIKAGRDDLHRLLTDGRLPLPLRLRLAVDGLNDLRLAIVLDNFEDCLDVETRRIVDVDLAQFYTNVTANLTRGTRVIVTCRYLPSGTPPDQPTVRHQPLTDFEEHDFIKFLRRDPTVDGRIRRGELGSDLLGEIYRRLGGTPGFLENVRHILRSADAIALAEDLVGIAPGRLTEDREAYYQRIFTARLYDLLSPAARGLVSRIALSALPLPLDALPGVVAGSTPPRGLSELVEECVAFGFLQEFTEPDLPNLYHPPGLLRPWLADPVRLSDVEASAIHRHLAVFWRRSFEEHREQELRVHVDAELLACREHARLGRAPPTFRWATVRLAWHLERRAEWRLARDLLQEVPEDERDGELLIALAGLEIHLGEWRLARLHLELALTRQPKGSQGEAAALHQLACIDHREVNFDAARSKFVKSLQITQGIGDHAGEAATWHQLSLLELHSRNFVAARDNAVRALGIMQAIGDRAGEAASWHQLAFVELHEGNSDVASEGFLKALAIRQDIGDRAGEAETWHSLALIEADKRDYAAARAKFLKALAIRQDIGDRPGEADTRHELASIDLREDSYGPARDNFVKALEIYQAIGDRPGEARALHQLASIDLRDRDYPLARERLLRALAIRQDIGDDGGEANTFYQLGFLAKALGRRHEAVRLVAICWVIDCSISDGNAESDFRDLSAMSRDLGYGQEQFDSMLRDAAAEYQSDRGRGFIARTFEPSTEGDSLVN